VTATRQRFSREKIQAVIAIYAAVVATTALGWQIRRDWQDRPVLEIQQPSLGVNVQDFHHDNTDIPFLATFTVANRGSRPLSVISIEAWPRIDGIRGIPAPDFLEPTVPFQIPSGGAVAVRLGASTIVRQRPTDDRKYTVELQLAVHTTNGVTSAQLVSEIVYGKHPVNPLGPAKLTIW